ncbi:hypothetical protein [Microseira wollei]|uniref:hypothetical protein n=1 Tax=Microseira wollei TaxID=467598 RepID=UPI001CFDEC9E|nr:hypothetical protein [Microseira wollei]
MARRLCAAARTKPSNFSISKVNGSIPLNYNHLLNLGRQHLADYSTMAARWQVAVYLDWTYGCSLQLGAGLSAREYRVGRKRNTVGRLALLLDK